MLQNQSEVYLPGAGVEWVHLWGDGTAVAGSVYVTVEAPMGYPPVFYRKGSPYETLFQEIAEEFGIEGATLATLVLTSGPTYTYDG